MNLMRQPGPWAEIGKQGPWLGSGIVRGELREREEWSVNEKPRGHQWECAWEVTFGLQPVTLILDSSLGPFYFIRFSFEYRFCWGSCFNHYCCLLAVGWQTVLVYPGPRGFWDMGPSVLKPGHSQANWDGLVTLIRGKLWQDLTVSSHWLHWKVIGLRECHNCWMSLTFMSARNDLERGAPPMNKPHNEKQVGDTVQFRYP